MQDIKFTKEKQKRIFLEYIELYKPTFNNATGVEDTEALFSFCDRNNVVCDTCTLWDICKHSDYFPVIDVKTLEEYAKEHPEHCI